MPRFLRVLEGRAVNGVYWSLLERDARWRLDKIDLLINKMFFL